MNAAKDQDQSMEEILQSIKRIIAEEGTPEASGSDVLELTDMLGEEESDVPMPDASPTIPSMSIDEIMAAPLSTGPAPEPATPEPAPEPEVAADPFDSLPDTPAAAPEPEPEPAPEPKPTPKAEAPKTAPVMPDEAGIASDVTIAAAASAMDALKNIPEAPVAPFVASGVGFRSGATIEDLVLEALRPMLKEWLDANLTGIVTSLVEKEVRRLSARS